MILCIEIDCDFVTGIFDKSEHDNCASLQHPSAKRERDRRKARRGTLVTRARQVRRGNFVTFGNHDLFDLERLPILCVFY